MVARLTLRLVGPTGDLKARLYEDFEARIHGHPPPTAIPADDIRRLVRLSKGLRGKDEWFVKLHLVSLAALAGLESSRGKRTD